MMDNFEKPINTELHEAYQLGINKGISDILTWQNIKSIVEIADNILTKDGGMPDRFAESEEKYYTEVLRLFKKHLSGQRAY